MKTNQILAVISLALLTYGIYNQEQSNDQYEQWKSKHNKLYLGTEDQYRRQIFHQNLILVNEHNKRYEQGLETYTLDTNLFADLTFEEFSSLYLYSTYKDQDVKQNKNSTIKKQSFKDVPTSFDWSTYIGGYSDAYSQGKCLASWAFAVAGSIEIAFYNSVQGAGAYIQRSPQQLINCVQQTNPCLEGSVSDTWAWAKNSEVYTEDDTPYKGQKNACTIPVPADGYKIADFVTVNGPFATHADYYSHIHDGTKGKAILVSPVSVSDIRFQLYQAGVYNGACNTPLNYDALVVGYDDTGVDNTSFYKLKMSWSQGYGENGYIRIAMANECLYTKLSYAI